MATDGINSHEENSSLFVVFSLGPLLLTWLNFIPSMDR